MSDSRDGLLRLPLATQTRDTGVTPGARNEAGPQCSPFLFLFALLRTLAVATATTGVDVVTRLGFRTRSTGDAEHRQKLLVLRQRLTVEVDLAGDDARSWECRTATPADVDEQWPTWNSIPIREELAIL